MAMQINLTPMRRDDQLTVSAAGDVLTINGEVVDLSTIADGETRPQTDIGCSWLASDVTRTGGVLSFTIILPCGADAPPETRFPVPIDVTSDGPVPLPPYETEPPA